MTGTTAYRVAAAALGWVDENRSGFALPPDVLDPATDLNRTLKPLGELAQLCASVQRGTAPDDPRHPLAADLLDFAWRETREGALFLDLLRCEPFATYPLEVYAAFADNGMRHPGVDSFAEGMARTRSWQSLEQLPNRRLGILNCERRTGFARRDAPWAALRRTWLGGLPEPWTFERASGYALTHTVFHLTDWGDAPQRVPPDITQYLLLWLPAWLDSCLEGEQWDLAGELLAVAASLPKPPPSDGMEAAWERMARAQDETGAVPESGADAHGHVMERTFATCYHSTLVAAFAATLTTARLQQDELGLAGSGGRTTGGVR